MIKGIHHISMKCETKEELKKVKEFFVRDNIKEVKY